MKRRRWIKIKKTSKITVASIQMRIGKSLENNFKEVKQLIKKAVNNGANAVCLPEYFFVPNKIASFIPSNYSEVYQEIIDFLASVSKDNKIIVVGNILESDESGYFNTCLIFENGKEIGKQRKVHPTEREEKFGIKHGDGFEVFQSKIGKLGVLVCADVLYPEAGRILGLKGADIVFNPVVSFYIENDVTKQARTCLFVGRSYDNDYFLVKAGGVGKSPFGAKIVGRSLITAPWGVLASAKNEDKPEVLIANLDMDLLQKVRDENYSLVRRTKEAYGPLVE